MFLEKKIIIPLYNEGPVKGKNYAGAWFVDCSSYIDNIDWNWNSENRNKEKEERNSCQVPLTGFVDWLGPVV